MTTLTENAIVKIKDILAEKNKPDICLRVLATLNVPAAAVAVLAYNKA